MVGDTGFEPVTSSVSRKRATAAPIARERDWSGQPGSNRRPQPWQGCALPTELCPPVSSGFPPSATTRTLPGSSRVHQIGIAESTGIGAHARRSTSARSRRRRRDGCRWLHADCASSRPCVLDLAHRAAARSAAASVDRRTPRRTSSPDAQPRRSCAPPTASRGCCSSSSPRCPTPACASCGGGCASTTTPQRPSVTSRSAVANASPCGRGAPPRCGPHRFAGPGHRRASDSSSASPAEPFRGALPDDQRGRARDARSRRRRRARARLLPRHRVVRVGLGACRAMLVGHPSRHRRRTSRRRATWHRAP